MALGDVGGDCDIDLVVGNTGEANRLYLNNGTSDPWGGVVGIDLTADSGATQEIALGDVNGDGSGPRVCLQGYCAQTPAGILQEPGNKSCYKDVTAHRRTFPHYSLT